MEPKADAEAEAPPQRTVEDLIQSGVDVPDDATEIDAWLKGQDFEKPAAPPEKETPDTGTKADEPAKPDPTGEDAAAAKPEDKPEGDEKRVIRTPAGLEIPYSVLKGTREELSQEKSRRKELEAERDRQTAEVNRLQGELEATRQTAQQAADAAGITDPKGRKVDVATVDVEKLRGQFDDDLVDTIAALQAESRRAREELAELRKREDGRVLTEEEARDQRRQEAIDAVPFLAEIQANKAADPDAWQTAIGLDASLRVHPDWKDKPIPERFAEVARQMQERLGKNQPKTDPKAEAQQQVQEKVDAALREAAKRDVPTTHSDLPAGTDVAQSDLENVEGMDVVSLNSKFESMTQEQIDDYLRKLA